MNRLILIVHNVRSAHNVGSLLRTADGFGVECVYLTGYTPYPRAPQDERLPHIATKIHSSIVKTALGAERSQPWVHTDDIFSVLQSLRVKGFRIIAVEQDSRSIPLPSYKDIESVAIIVGREVEGIETEVRDAVDQIVEIPMIGAKESFNVSVAAGIALYHFRYMF